MLALGLFCFVEIEEHELPWICTYQEYIKFLHYDILMCNLFPDFLILGWFSCGFYVCAAYRSEEAGSPASCVQVGHNVCIVYMGA